MNHHVDEPDEATHPEEDSDKKEKYTMMVRRVQDEARSIGSFAATLPMGLCSLNVTYMNDYYHDPSVANSPSVANHGLASQQLNDSL